MRKNPPLHVLGLCRLALSVYMPAVFSLRCALALPA